MSTKDFSNAQEWMVSNYLGWNRVSGSGGATCTAGDVISDKFLGECKTHETEGSKVVFRQDVWSKIQNESMVFGRIPVLIVDDGTQEWRRTYCLINPPADSSILPKDEFHVMKFDVNFKKHLSFDPDKLYNKFKKKDNAIYVVPWFDGNVWLMKLQTFNEYQQYV